MLYGIELTQFALRNQRHLDARRDSFLRGMLLIEFPNKTCPIPI